MKIVSKQTLQKLIRHQLLEHYTKKFNLLTEGDTFDNDTLRGKIDILLPDKCPIAGFDSPQTTVRDCLILICLYELINSANASIQNKLSNAGITIDLGIVTAISTAIEGFFRNSLTIGITNTVNYKNSNDFISALQTKIKNPFKENDFLNKLPDFLKQFIMKAEDLSNQITADLCQQIIDGEWGVSGVWKNDNGSVAIPLNPWAGRSYNGQLKEKTPDGIISKLEAAIDQIVAKSSAPTGESEEDRKKREAEAAAKLNEKQQKRKKRDEDIVGLEKKINNTHNMSGMSVLDKSDIDEVNKASEIDDELRNKIAYNSQTLVTQLLIYYIFLNAAEKTADGTTIYKIPGVRDMIAAIDSSATDGSKLDVSEGPIRNYDDYILENLSEKKLGFNIYSELYHQFNEDKIYVANNDYKDKMEAGLRKLHTFNQDIIKKINAIDKKTNPLANNLKLFLNQIALNQFKEIRDAIKNSTRFRSSFDYYDDNDTCAIRLHNSDRVITTISNYFKEKIAGTVLGDFRVQQTQLENNKKELEKNKKENETEDAADKAEVEKDKAPQLQSPNPKIIPNDEWNKVIKRIQILQNTPKQERNPKEISDIKKIIRLLEDKGISKEKVQQALKDLNALEQEGQSGVSKTGSGNDKNAESQSDSDSTAEVADNDGLEDIFRLPQLNKGYFQLARILTDTAALKSYKSGNFKREKYDKADSYGYIFMDDTTLNKAGDVYNVAVKTIVAKMGDKGVNLSPAVQTKIETELKDYKKIGNYLNEYFNKKMLLANEYLYIDGKVYLYLALRVLEDVGLDSPEFKELHDEFVVNKDPVVLPHNIKIQNLDDALAKKVDLSKRISIDQMFQNRKAKAAAATVKNQKSNDDTSSTSNSKETNSAPSPIEDEGISAEKSLKRVKALITQLGGKMFKEDIEKDDLVNRAAGGQYSIRQLGKEIVTIANTVYQRSADYEFSEFEKKQLKLGLQNYFEQKLSDYNNLDGIIIDIKKKINQF